MQDEYENTPFARVARAADRAMEEVLEEDRLLAALESVNPSAVRRRRVQR